MIRQCLLGLVLVAMVSCSDDDEPPIGVVDAASMAACAAFPNGTAVTAATTAEGAASIELHRESAHRVTLSGEGFVTLHADVGHFDWAIFVSEETTLANDELGFAGATRAGACPDVGLWDYRVHVHEGGEYVLHLHHHGEGPVFAYAYRTESSHSGDASVDDGGAHMHGDGGHDEDAGEHMHGDGGHDMDAGEHMHDGDAGEHEHGDAG